MYINLFFSFHQEKHEKQSLYNHNKSIWFINGLAAPWNKTNKHNIQSPCANMAEAITDHIVNKYTHFPHFALVCLDEELCCRWTTFICAGHKFWANSKIKLNNLNIWLKLISVSAEKIFTSFNHLHVFLPTVALILSHPLLSYILFHWHTLTAHFYSNFIFSFCSSFTLIQLCPNKKHLDQVTTRQKTFKYITRSPWQ